MVLTQRDPSPSEEDHNITFPYHYGSYATIVYQRKTQSTT